MSRRKKASLQFLILAWLFLLPMPVCGQSDATAIHKAAHSFKSSSAHVGALALAALCKELESMGRADSIENAMALLTETEKEYETVQAALTAQLQKEINNGEAYL